MSDQPRAVDWSRYDGRTRSLEAHLQRILRSEPWAGDDRRLARVYMAIAKLLRSRMPGELIGYLDGLETLQNDPGNAVELNALSSRLGSAAWQAQAAQPPGGEESDQSFLYRLMESCTKTKFTIDPETDVEPIGWAVALGVPYDDLRKAVLDEYSEISADV